MRYLYAKTIQSAPPTVEVRATYPSNSASLPAVTTLLPAVPEPYLAVLSLWLLMMANMSANTFLQRNRVYTLMCRSSSATPFGLM